MLALIRGSLTVQEKDTVAATGEGSGRRVLVIGGAGHMGALVRALPRARRASRSRSPTPSTAPDRRARTTATGARVALDHELIVVAAPMPATAAILDGDGRGAAEGHRVRRRLAEVPAAQAASRRCARPAAGSRSVHPMFGPDTELLSGRHVIFVDLGAPDGDRRGARAVRADDGDARRDGSREPRPADRVRARAVARAQHRVLHRARRERRGRAAARDAVVDDVRRAARRRRARSRPRTPISTSRSRRSTTTAPSRSRRCSTRSSGCARSCAPTTSRASAR